MGTGTGTVTKKTQANVAEDSVGSLNNIMKQPDKTQTLKRTDSNATIGNDVESTKEQEYDRKLDKVNKIKDRQENKDIEKNKENKDIEKNKENKDIGKDNYIKSLEEDKAELLKEKAKHEKELEKLKEQQEKKPYDKGIKESIKKKEQEIKKLDKEITKKGNEIKDYKKDQEIIAKNKAFLEKWDTRLKKVALVGKVLETLSKPAAWVVKAVVKLANFFKDLLTFGASSSR